MIVLWAPIEIISYGSLSSFSALFSSFKFSGTVGFAFFTYVILNICAAIVFEFRIARKDIEYLQWRSMY